MEAWADLKRKAALGNARFRLAEQRKTEMFVELNALIAGRC